MTDNDFLYEMEMLAEESKQQNGPDKLQAALDIARRYNKEVVNLKRSHFRTNDNVFWSDFAYRYDCEPFQGTVRQAEVLFSRLPDGCSLYDPNVYIWACVAERNVYKKISIVFRRIADDKGNIIYKRPEPIFKPKTIKNRKRNAKKGWHESVRRITTLNMSAVEQRMQLNSAIRDEDIPRAKALAYSIADLAEQMRKESSELAENLDEKKFDEPVNP